MDKVIVIDTSAVVHFFQFYIFDKNEKKIIYNKLYKFFFDKVKSGEIIIIDRVEKELDKWYWFKREIKGKVVSTLDLVENVDELVNKYRVKENESKYSNTINMIQDLNRYSSDIAGMPAYADLFLIEYCKKLKEEGKNPILINGESRKRDNKLIKKIPEICDGEKVISQPITHMLFELYKDELVFSLEIK